MRKWLRLMCIIAETIAIIGGVIIAGAAGLVLGAVIARHAGLGIAFIYAIVVLGTVIGFLQWRDEVKYGG